VSEHTSEPRSTGLDERLHEDQCSAVSGVKTVTVITRVDCHLCTDAVAVVARLSSELGFDWSSIDVDADPDRQDAYGDRVPVILVNGREHGYWRVEEDRLRAALA
jgi:glutaredoxin